MRDAPSNPVKMFLKDVAGGWRPTRTDIDTFAKTVAEGSDTSLSNHEVAQKLTRAVDKIRELRKFGNRGDARKYALETGTNLAALIGDVEIIDPMSHETDPGKLAAHAMGETPAAELDPNDPGALASRVSQF